MSSRNFGLRSGGGLAGSAQVTALPRSIPEVARETGKSGRDRAEECERVQDASMLRVVALVSLLCVAGAALSEQDIGYGPYSYPADAYGGEPVYGVPFVPQGGRSADFGAGNMAYPPSGVSDRGNDPYRDDPYRLPSNDLRYGQAPGIGYQSYPPVGEGAPDWGGGGRRFEGPRDGADGYAGGWISGRELPPAAVRGYRFRGDSPDGDGSGIASDWRGGYRFRPLSEPERKRLGAVRGWRPRERERSGNPPGRPAPLPIDEAYGYESDNWFRRYYRERP